MVAAGLRACWIVFRISNFDLQTSISRSEQARRPALRLIALASELPTRKESLIREAADGHLAQHFFLLVRALDDFLERRDEFLLVVD